MSGEGVCGGVGDEGEGRSVCVCGSVCGGGESGGRGGECVRGRMVLFGVAGGSVWCVSEELFTSFFTVLCFSAFFLTLFSDFSEKYFNSFLTVFELFLIYRSPNCIRPWCCF